MILYINTTDFNKVIFALSDDKKIRQKTYKIDSHKSHETLGKLDEFFKSQKISNPKSAIVKIIVNKGPGSYTGVRIGVTIAMALGFAWGIQIKPVSNEKFKIAA